MLLFADDAVQGVDAVSTLQAEIAVHGADAADAVDAAHGVEEEAHADDDGAVDDLLLRLRRLLRLDLEQLLLVGQCLGH